MKRVYLTIGMVLLLAVAQLAVAEGKGGYGARGPGKMHKGARGGAAGCGVRIILKLKDELGISATQAEQLEAIGDEVQGQVKASAEAIKTKRNALQELVKSGASEAVIRAAASEVGNAIGDHAVLRVSAKAKVDAILTAEQIAKLEELREQRMESRKKQRGKRRQKAGQGTEGRKGYGGKAINTESAFARIDTDGNGEVSLEEFQAHMEQMRERHGNKGPRNRRRPRPEGAATESDN